MIKLKREELKNFFELRKKLIEKPVYSGLGEIVSGISLWISLWTSEFEPNPYISTTFLDFGTFFLGVILFGFGIYNFYHSIFFRQTTQNLYDSLLELDCEKCHVVDIVLFHNKSNGKYLLVKNKAWNCALFPSYSAVLPFNAEQETHRVAESFVRDTGIQPTSVTYLGQMEPHIKLCCGTNTPYRYHFHFFRIEIAAYPNMLKEYNGKKYTWKSLDSMIKDKNIMKKNSDVVEYIADLEGIPYN